MNLILLCPFVCPLTVEADRLFFGYIFMIFDWISKIFYSDEYEPML
jgi:hypothetical protein